MDSMSYTTFGRDIYPGHAVKIYCCKDVTSFEYACPEQRFRIVYIKSGHAIFQNGTRSQIVTGPALLCLNHEDVIQLKNESNLLMDIMYFDPICFERYVEYPSIEEWKKQIADDAYFFRPFFYRDEHFIGACSVSPSFGNRIANLISLASEELLKQRDNSWPCRSRSFFIELLLSVNSIFDGDYAQEQIFSANMSDEIMNIVDWIHIHALEKLTLEDITREFHTNKTTLNQKFKAVMGVTVMDYVITLRMQVACSLLSKTFLPVSEVVFRSGYRDDAHFLRAFKKYAGCTPTEYRGRPTPNV